MGSHVEEETSNGKKALRRVLGQPCPDTNCDEDTIVLSFSASEDYVSAAYATTQCVTAIDDLVYNAVELGAETVSTLERGRAGGTTGAAST